MTTHLVAGLLFVLGIFLAGSIGFNAGVKWERKRWRLEFSKVVARRFR